MTRDELNELLAQAAEIGQRDVHMGRMLGNMIGHLASAHGLSVSPEEEAPAEEEEEAPVAPSKGKVK